MPYRSRPPVSSSLCLLASLFVFACGSSDEGEASTNMEEESSAESADTNDTETDTGGGDPVCFPEGIYGPCSGEGMGCQCLMGADVYQVCTMNCTEDSECGDPADYPGATPQCAPLNPGEEQMFCSLGCTTDAQCPCGLTCQPLMLICVEDL